MTAPLRQDVTLDEVIAAEKAGEKTKLGEIKLEGDDIPEELRGKTVADVLKMTTGAMGSLKQSEERRLILERAVAEGKQPQVIVQQAQPKVEDEEPELTKDEWNDLFAKDPLAAIEYRERKAQKRIEKNVDGRLGTLASGARTAAETAARAAYPEEFELFGDQITAMIERLPDASTLSMPQAWDDMISYISGKRENRKKWLEHQQKKDRDAAATRAREAEVAAAGPGVVGTVRAPVKTVGDTGLDEMQDAARIQMGLSVEEYKKWMATS